MSYTSQLEEIINIVLKESNLFDEHELQIIILYRSLPQEVQLLYYYLLQRTGNVRLGDVEGYADKIPAWKDAIDLLLESKLLTASEIESVDNGLGILKKDELTRLAKKRRINSNSKTVGPFLNLIKEFKFKTGFARL